MSPAHILKFVALGALLILPPQTRAAPQQDARRLGIDVQASQDGDYGKALQIARGAGARFVSLSLNWEDIERAPQTYENPNLQIANEYYPAQHIPIQLCIRPLDTNGPHLPSDLRNLPMDSPIVIERFVRLIDYVLDHLAKVSLVSLGIGNEVDAPLGTDTKKWAQYRRFFEAARAHIKLKRPGLSIGVPVTFTGATGAARGEVKALNAASDLVMVTYYPLKPDFTVQDPAVVLKDFNRLTQLYAGRKIAFVEAGYPSGAACGSSETKQAEFVRRIFQAWNAHAAQIPQLSFSWLNDKSPADVDGFTRYYALNTAGFREYLGTLGLRTYGGTEKKAFRVLMLENHRRFDDNMTRNRFGEKAE